MARPLAFALLSVALAWLVALPLYAGGGLASPLFLPITVLVMYTPTVALVLLHLTGSRPGRRRRLRDAAGLGTWRWKAIVGWSAVAIGLGVLTSVAAIPAGALLAGMPVDLSFHGYEALLTAQAGPLPMPIEALVLVQVASILPASLFNALAAFGEEAGWRGYLAPVLLERLGIVGGLLVSGIIWGLWHAPLLLLGYNYPIGPRWTALAAMVGFCTVYGVLLTWVRMRSDNVLPAAFGHGALNAGAALYLLVLPIGYTPDQRVVSPLGWTGWVAPGLIALVLMARWLRRPARLTRPAGAPRTPAVPPGTR